MEKGLLWDLKEATARRSDIKKKKKKKKKEKKKKNKME